MFVITMQCESDFEMFIKKSCANKVMLKDHENFTMEQYGSFNRYSKVNDWRDLKREECSILLGSAEMNSSIPCFRALSVSEREIKFKFRFMF